MKRLRIPLILFIVFILAFTSVPMITEGSTTLSMKSVGWIYTNSVNHQTPEVLQTTQDLFKKNNAFYIYNTNQKVIYLTLDIGYENGYTTKILDVLKKHKIKATFFVCKGFITKNPAGLKRMVKEGHLVGNHTVNHLNLSTLSQSKIKSELDGVSKAYENVTGKKMAKIMRPPSGNYSESSLSILNKLGYETIFWSINLPNDWNMKNQPSKSSALALFPEENHNGAIALLHGVSPTVANNLDEMLTQLEKEGYKFRLISELKPTTLAPSPVVTYNVNFNSQGGSNVGRKIVNTNIVLTAPSVPKKVGYTFLGWYKDLKYNTLWSFGKDRVKQNTTLYAKWSKNPSAPHKITASKTSATGAKISWSKVSGVKGYELYQAKTSAGNYQLLTSTTGSGYVKKSLTKGRTYYYKLRAYTIVNKKKVYSAYTKIAFVKL